MCTHNGFRHAQLPTCRVSSELWILTRFTMRMGTTQAAEIQTHRILGRKVTDSLNDKDAGFQRRGRGFQRQYAGFYEAKGSH